VRSLSLVDLVAQIVEGNEAALREFHEERTVFSFRDDKALLFACYVDRLRGSASESGTTVADEAYSLTVDKFNRLPSVTAGPGNDCSEARTGPDCRIYFRPFLLTIERRRSQRRPLSLLEEEFASARLLQGHVRRHFRLSVLECYRRACPGMSRYVWQLPAGNISVMMPEFISGRARKQWLEGHVENPDPRHPDESQRVQGIVNQQLGSAVVSGDSVESWALEVTEGAGTRYFDDPDLVVDLAEAVAEEKADNIDEQRQSIRELGPVALNAMIRRIFSTLSDGEGCDREIADAFGLSRIAFSRFAGTRWGVRSSIPDLWANTAHVLAGDRRFADVAKAMGVWPGVERMSRASGRSGVKGGGK
jgi:hypothetical protein